MANATLETLKDLAGSGVLMLLGTAAVNWLVSENALEYLARVRDAQTMRLRMKHRCA